MKKVGCILTICILSGTLFVGCANQGVTITETIAPTTAPPYIHEYEESENEKSVYSDTYNLYDKEITVLEWYGNSLNFSRPKEIAIENKKYIYEYDDIKKRVLKKIYDGNTLIEEVSYEYTRDNMDNPILSKEVHPNYNISFIWQLGDKFCELKGFTYKNKDYFYKYGDLNHPFWVKYIHDENGNIVAEYEYAANEEGYIECNMIEYTEQNIGSINPIRYGKDYCDYETGFIVSNSSYYLMKDDYVAVRPNLEG